MEEGFIEIRVREYLTKEHYKQLRNKIKKDFEQDIDIRNRKLDEINLKIEEE